jgi:hypothetical protein
LKGSIDIHLWNSIENLLIFLIDFLIIYLYYHLILINSRWLIWFRSFLFFLFFNWIIFGRCLKLFHFLLFQILFLTWLIFGLFMLDLDEFSQKIFNLCKLLLKSSNSVMIGCNLHLNDGLCDMLNDVLSSNIFFFQLNLNNILIQFRLVLLLRWLWHFLQQNLH